MIAVVEPLLHTIWSVGWLTWPDGLTVIVNVLGVPGQLIPPLVKVGVTVIVAITGEVPEFKAVKDGIFPFPEAAKPILELLLVVAVQA